MPTKDQAPATNKLSLNDLLMQGEIQKEQSVTELLKKVDMRPVDYAGNTTRIRDISFLSPHITGLKLYAAIHRLGGAVEQIRNTTGISKMGTNELDLQIAENAEQLQDDKLKTVKLGTFDHAELYGSPGTNVLILTTDHGNFARRGMDNKELDSARRWLLERGITIRGETVVSQYHLDGPGIYTESVAFVVEQ